MRALNKLGVIAMILGITSCALPTKVKIVDIAVQETVPSTNGPTMTIISVKDIRDLGDGELEKEETGDPNVVARAYGTKGVGLTRGTILLPPGRTVMDVVAEAIEEAFRRSGYVVLSEEDPGSEQAVPVEVSILHFWTWKDERETHFEFGITITAPIASFTESKLIYVHTTVRPNSWKTLGLLRMDTFEAARKQGIAQLVERVARTLVGTINP